jgi:hypothetical protein
MKIILYFIVILTLQIVDKCGVYCEKTSNEEGILVKNLKVISMNYDVGHMCPKYDSFSSKKP